ncbi:unnamed protein product [Allacma fusca]|uniref:F-box domain-containing protein n=1 Tax=Allacma fusca TaxID=39272 RepID=A0A8J2LKI0_9HEXA|nr:unnamed protein product [Allacma fusca]
MFYITKLFGARKERPYVPVQPSKEGIFKGAHRKALEMETASTRTTDMPANTANAEWTVSSEALSNHLILTQIFRHFDTRTLLNLSLVNKTFCCSARSALRRKRCLAYIDGPDPCNELLLLNDSLVKSPDAPYTGLAIRITRNCSYPSCQELDVALTYPALLSMKHRHLEIHCEKESNCSAQRLLMLILKECGKNLKELKISALPHDIISLEEWIGIDEAAWLAKLKVLNIYSEATVKRSVKHELIQASPQLEKLLGFYSHDDLDFLLEQNKASKVDHFIFRHCFRWFSSERMRSQYKINCINNSIRFAAASPKLTMLTVGDLDRYFYGNASHEAVESFKIFLKSVAPSLEELRTDHFDLVLMLLQTPTQPMTQVERLEFTFCNRMDQNFGFPTLERLDWGRWFPNLKTVHITRRYSFSTIWDISEDVWNTSQFSPCSSVQEIVLVQELSNELFNSFDFEAMTHLTRVFPNVKEFTIFGVASQLDSLLELLWTWPQLETINLRSVKIKAGWYNKDSAFCGMPKKQVGMYIKKSPAALRNINFVPSEPSILSLTKLKNLSLEFIHPIRDINWDDSIPGILHPSRFFLSHVTGVLAFSRMPQLRVKIVRESCCDRCRYKLDHLTPYVSLVDVDGEYIEQNCKY